MSGLIVGGDGSNVTDAVVAKGGTVTSILICENCDCGYALTLSNCPYCGCHNQMSYTAQLGKVVFDTECYRNYWLISFMSLTDGTVTEFQLFDDHPLDVQGILRVMTTNTCIGFNSNKYDMPIITLALSGATNQMLKDASDAIIQTNLQPWLFYQQYGLDEPRVVDHIDLFEVTPGQGSLKAYGGKMHTRKLQDLPIPPDASIGVFDRVLLREYCGNDLRVTAELYHTFPAQIALREQMGAEYGIDLRSKSDAQMAEAAMKASLDFKVERLHVPAGTQFYYEPPEWIKFQHLDLLALLARCPFTVTDTGSVEMSEELEQCIVRIGGSSYKMGSGGLHSMESKVVYRANDTYSLRMPDVASYYPSLVLRTGIYPVQIGEPFNTIYRGWYTRRLAAKAAGDKKTANSLKTLCNGTFGKLGSKWSIFYTPNGMIQVTLTGQLALLMLIEALEEAGLSVVSANTDGIVVYTERANDWLVDSIIQWWESVTGFTMEMTDFNLLAARDVNSYVGITSDGDVKLKGAFSRPEPGASGWPNPTGQVCVDAVVAYLRDGVPIYSTVRQCDDIKQFVYVRSVTGGGQYNPNGVLDKNATLTAMRAALGIRDTGNNQEVRDQYELLRAHHNRDARYLGKTVRWYYGTGSKGCITYVSSGNRVPQTDGCVPMMELTDMIPDDLDRDWYINEAQSMLRDMGVTV